ncbi:MAG: hypothetical protein WCN81_00125 [Actinomycetes bacterium]
METLIAFLSDNRLSATFDPSTTGPWRVTNVDPVGLIDIGRVVGIGPTLQDAVDAYNAVLTDQRDGSSAKYVEVKRGGADWPLRWAVEL